MDASADKAADGGHLDCIGLATALEEPRLWGVSLMAAPMWGRLEWLRVLEIVVAPLWDSAVKDAITTCPDLTDLSLLGCDCFLGAGNYSLLVAAPRIESLEVQGFTWITLRGGHSLRRFSIAKSTGAQHTSNHSLSNTQIDFFASCSIALRIYCRALS